MNELKYPFLMSILSPEENNNYLAKFPSLPKYPFLISILPPEEGGGYLIEFPDLPGCMSDGETIEKTIENGKDAVFCWIETAKEFGDEIPQPGSNACLASQRKSSLVSTQIGLNETQRDTANNPNRPET